MLVTILAIFAAAIAIWAMVDISRNHRTKQVSIAWFAVVVLLPVVGPIAYYLKTRHYINFI